MYCSTSHVTDYGASHATDFAALCAAKSGCGVITTPITRCSLYPSQAVQLLQTGRAALMSVPVRPCSTSDSAILQRVLHFVKTIRKRCVHVGCMFPGINNSKSELFNMRLMLRF